MNLTNQKESPAIYNEFDRLLLVVTLLLVFLMATRTPLDSDMWWHLRSGQIMVETGKPLLVDVFSFTRAGTEWTNHSWLGEVVLFLIYQSSGFAGLSVWMGLMAVAIALFIWLQMEGGAFHRAVFVLFASIVSAPLWTPRPQFFSLVFLAGLTWWVGNWLNTGGKRIWYLIPFFILWSNLHGGFVLGILYLLVYAASLLFELLEDNKIETKKNKVPAFWLAGMAIGGYTVAAINPNGIKMWAIPFETVGVGVLQKLIQEWASPDFHNPEVWPFAMLVILLLLMQLLNIRKLKPALVLPGIFFILMAFMARRNIGAAAIAAVPWLAACWRGNFSDWLSGEVMPALFPKMRDILKKNQKPVQNTPYTRIANLLIVGLLSMVCFFKIYSVTHPVVVSAFEEKANPVAAVNYMKSNPISNGENLFNTYNWGGYLIWNFPSQKIFVDGRTDLFGDKLLGEFLNVIQADQGWDNTLSKWNITRIIIEPDRPLAKILPYEGWSVVFQDKTAIVFDKLIQ